MGIPLYVARTVVLDKVWKTNAEVLLTALIDPNERATEVTLDSLGSFWPLSVLSPFPHPSP